MNACKEIILLILQNFVIVRYSWCYQFSNTSLDNGFCKFGIFQLITNSNPVSGPYQFWQISIE